MEENKIIKEDTTDRISQLPECIIEDILLRLDKPKERLRVSVLSKKWLALIASVPVLKFLYSDFADEEEWISNRDVRNNFYNYLKYTVFRFCLQQNVKIAHKFKLLTVAGDDKEFYIIDNCVELILRKGVKELDICVKKNKTSKRRIGYRLPGILSSSILSSGSTLTSLKISGSVVLPSSLMVRAVNFKFLKVLWLTNASLDPLVIKHLTTTCPLLEELVVVSCYGFKKFCVSGQNLKTLRFCDHYGNEIETIDIEAPNLRECFLTVEGRVPTSVILGSCRRLRTLYFDGPFLQTSIRFSDFLSNFPVLENLFLSRVNRRNILTVCSPSLKNFVLYDECDLEEIDLNTPNLRLFSYSNSSDCSKGEFAIKRDARELETCMEYHILNKVDTVGLLKLRRFLEKSNKFKFLKLIDLYERLSVDSEQLTATQLPPYELERVELKLPTTHALSVLGGLLWCFRPRSLSLTSGFSRISDAERSHFIKVISEKLIQQEDDQDPTNIRIEWSVPLKDQIYFSWNSMLTTLTFHETTQTITFKKEEGRHTDEGHKWRNKYQRQHFKHVEGSSGKKRRVMV